ncbi:hypothetical protein HPB50_010198 [Hyalomma asiaticum]|uniref:Uncharacterized protein n=1 Tax=Hyalomma asiaticum TaxID=266040 RepID=A0ACB7SRN3_HYAAI|nr:hypothetical protein HPB50_010198 [Hyalomma asiaticum]
MSPYVPLFVQVLAEWIILDRAAIDAFSDAPVNFVSACSTGGSPDDAKEFGLVKITVLAKLGTKLEQTGYVFSGITASPRTVTSCPWPGIRRPLQGSRTTTLPHRKSAVWEASRMSSRNLFWALWTGNSFWFTTCRQSV